MSEKALAKVDTSIAVKNEESAVEFIPFGANQKVRLTASMVRQFVAVPTKSGALPTEKDCIKFIMLCKGKRANPFEGDCFLIGYDSAQAGPQFSLVCGIELFLKRAEQSDDYDGRRSGVVVEKNGVLTEREGTLVLDGEKLVGGWAKVFRKNHSHPEYKVVKFSTYDTGRSRWAKDPAGQIEKVALSQALRQAYPTALGGLYTQDEMQKVAESGDGIADTRSATLALTDKYAKPQEALPALPEPEPSPLPDPEPSDEPGPSQVVSGPCEDGYIQEVKAKTGSTRGKEWTRYGVLVNDQWHNTFDGKLADACTEAKAKGLQVVLEYEVNAKGFRDIKAVHASTNTAPPSDPTEGMEEGIP